MLPRYVWQSVIDGTLYHIFHDLLMTLPAAGPESSANALLSFSLNPEWVKGIGEGAVNQASEATLFNFLPRNNAGITTQGPAIIVLADVLETWVQRYPTSVVLQKWVKNALD